MELTDTPILARAIDLRRLLARNSYFLLGPRQTGKSFLVHHTLPDVRLYDLLDSSTYLTLSRNPGRIAEELTERERVVVIDEVQRFPELLNEVHRLIETRRVHFLLTGSSARKLRGGGVNLLGGRARTQYLHPLTSHELRVRFDLARAAERGLLPSTYFSDDPQADLAAYSGTYLQQEIVAAGVTRNVPAFSRFLKVAALCNGTIVNFTNVANDAQVPRTTVYEYFDICGIRWCCTSCRRGESRSNASRLARRSIIFRCRHGRRAARTSVPQRHAGVWPGARDDRVPRTPRPP